MKTKTLSTFAAITVFAAFAGITFNILAPALFLAAVMTFLVLIVAHDYTPQERRWLTMASLSAERLPYAA